METIVESTRNYEKFKTHRFNRGICFLALSQLIDNIKEENALFAHPIIVDSDWFVIDGQHRLEAAKKLELPIYYIVTDDISDRHVLGANVNQRPWTVTEIIKYYANAEKKPDYIDLLRYMNELDLKPKGVLGLLGGYSGRTVMMKVKKGTFLMPNNEIDINSVASTYSRLREFVQKRKITPRTMFSSSQFTRALNFLVTNSDFSEEMFFLKLEKRWFHLLPQPNHKSWYRLLLSIYNFNNRIASIENKLE